MGWSEEGEAGTAIVPHYATWGRRLAATLLDGLILLLPTLIVSLVTDRLVANVLQAAYFVYFTGATGQTPGKQLMKIRVVRASGGPMDFGVAALREVVGKFVSAITLGIGYLFPLWDARKQALHDKVAGTVVVFEG